MTWQRLRPGGDAASIQLPGLRGVQMRSVEPRGPFLPATPSARRLRSTRSGAQQRGVYSPASRKQASWPSLTREAHYYGDPDFVARAAARAALRHLYCRTPPIDRPIRRFTWQLRPGDLPPALLCTGQAPWWGVSGSVGYRPMAVVDSARKPGGSDAQRCLARPAHQWSRVLEFPLAAAYQFLPGRPAPQCPGAP